MRGMLIGMVAAIGSISWLDLLVVTRFNAAAVGAGLFVAVVATGTSSARHED
jgi:hypothetical protein